jgi:signal peptidase II
VAENASLFDLTTPLRAARPRGTLSRLASSCAMAGVVVGADQLTKWLATTVLAELPSQSVPVVGDLFRLTYVYNRGAAFGILQDRTFFFVVVSLFVVAMIVASYRYFPVTGPMLHIALGLQLGGAMGNLVDRVRLGYVVDFLDLALFPVFNIADAAIVIGVGILAYHLLRNPDSSLVRRRVA